MSHARQLVDLYRQFYRASRYNSNSILRPIAVAARTILNADPRLFDRPDLTDAVRGELAAFMDRAKTGRAEGRLAPGSTAESRERRRCVVLPNILLGRSLSDIEQPLTGRNLIKPTDLFPKQAKDFDLHLVEAFNQVVDLALHGHADAMNPFEQLEDPTQGRPLRRLVDLVRYRLVLTR